MVQIINQHFQHTYENHGVDANFQEVSDTKLRELADTWADNLAKLDGVGTVVFENVLRKGNNEHGANVIGGLQNKAFTGVTDKHWKDANGTRHRDVNFTFDCDIIANSFTL